MDNIVLDTNALIMCISPKSAYHIAWKAFLDGKYCLCVTNEIIEEYSEVLGRNINPLLADFIVNTILTRNNVKLYDPHFRLRLITADNDDNKFVDCAFAATAKFIVSEDKHFKVLEKVPFPHINVIGINEFCDDLNHIF